MTLYLFLSFIKGKEEGVVMQPKPRPLAPPSHQLVLGMGLNPHRIQVMKATFTHAAEKREGARESEGAREGERASEREGGSTHQLLQTSRVLAPLPARFSLAPLARGGLDRQMGQVQFRDTPSPIPFPSRDYHPSSYPPSTPLLLQRTPVPTPSQSLLEFAGGVGERDTSGPFDLSSSSFLSARSRPLPPPNPTLRMPRRDFSFLVPPHESVTYGRSRIIADAGLFLGRSFRVGWGPNWTLVHSGLEITGASGSVGSDNHAPNLPLRVVIERIAPTPLMVDAPPEKISVGHILMVKVLSS